MTGGEAMRTVLRELEGTVVGLLTIAALVLGLAVAVQLRDLHQRDVDAAARCRADVSCPMPAQSRSDWSPIRKLGERTTAGIGQVLDHPDAWVASHPQYR